MKVQVIRAHELRASHIELWREIQRADPTLNTPFLSPEIVRLTAEVRSGVRIAIIRESGEVTGFFPFSCRSWFGAGLPVPDSHSDYHGLVAADPAGLSATALIRGCGLSSWRFNHLPSSQQAFREHVSKTALSPIMDLSAGFEDYRRSRARQLNRIEAKARKLEREIGPVRFEACCKERAVWDRFTELLDDQRERHDRRNPLRTRWFRNLCARLQQFDTPEFAGMLSVLYVGEQIAAAHLGIRSDATWHYWIPTYSPVYSRYSPGLIMMLRMVETCPDLGIRTIDMGRGLARHKEEFMNGSIEVAEGCVRVPSLSGSAHELVQAFKTRLRTSALGPSVLSVYRRVRGL